MPAIDFRDVKRMFRGSTSIKSAYLGSGLVWQRQAAANDADIIKLFAANEQGAWFDASDLSTLFQDVAGTIPANTPGHPVGLMLDKSGRGNHATQSTDARRPTLGRHPVGGRRNELLNTEALNAGSWTVVNTVGTGSIIRETTANAAHSFRRNAGAGFNAGTYTVSFIFKSVSNNAGFTIFASSDAGNASYRINSLTGEFSLGSVAMGNTSCNVIPLADGYFKIVFTFTTTGVLAYWDIRLSNVWPISGFVGNPYQGDGISGIEMLQPQFERGAVATNYQRVTTQFDVTEVGVDDRWHLQFNGSNQSMSTGTIDFTGTDEMMVIAGLRKTTTGTAGVLAELGGGSSSGPGIFSLFAPHPPGGSGPLIQFRWWTNLGNASRFGDDTEIAKASPYLGVVAATAKGSGKVELRVNHKAFRGNDSLAGNFGNFPLYIGARTASAIYYAGNLYGLIVRGKIATEQDLLDAEFQMANKVGMTL